MAKAQKNGKIPVPNKFDDGGDWMRSRRQRRARSQYVQDAVNKSMMIAEELEWDEEDES